MKRSKKEEVVGKDWPENQIDQQHAEHRDI